MATLNPFDMLGDDDNDDPNVLIAAVQKQKAADVAAATAVAAVTAAQKGDVKAAAVPAKNANFPSKPVAPPQFVKDRADGGRGGGRGFGRGRGGGYNRDQTNENNFAPNDAVSGGYKPSDDKDGEKRGYGGPRPAYQGARRGGYNNGEAVEGERPPRREYVRRSGTGRGNGVKREGSGRLCWLKDTWCR